MSTISRNQKYFRTRENRNFSTVRSTERRIFNFSVIEGLMMVSMAALQVFVVRFFFQGARKGTFLSQLDLANQSYRSSLIMGQFLSFSQSSCYAFMTELLTFSNRLCVMSMMKSIIRCIFSLISKNFGVRSNVSALRVAIG